MAAIGMVVNATHKELGENATLSRSFSQSGKRSRLGRVESISTTQSQM